MFAGSPALLSKSNLPSVVTLDSTTLTTTLTINFRCHYLLSSLLHSLRLVHHPNINFSHISHKTGTPIYTPHYHSYLHRLISHLKVGPLQLPSLWSPAYVLSNLQSLQIMPPKCSSGRLIRACLDRLHRLPVAQRSKLKLMWLVANILTTVQPYMIFSPFDTHMNHLDPLNTTPSCISQFPRTSSLVAFFSRQTPTYGTIFPTTFARQLR